MENEHFDNKLKTKIKYQMRRMKGMFVYSAVVITFRRLEKL